MTNKIELDENQYPRRNAVEKNINNILGAFKESWLYESLQKISEEDMICQHQSLQ